MATEIKKRNQGPFFKPPLEKKRKVRNRAHKPRADIDPKHLENIRKLRCCCCGTLDKLEAHHLKFGTGERGAGMKSSDKWSIPMCVEHHQDVEKVGSRNELHFFRQYDIKPLDLASALWNARGDLEKMNRIVMEHMGL